MCLGSAAMRWSWLHAIRRRAEAPSAAILWITHLTLETFANLDQAGPARHSPFLGAFVLANIFDASSSHMLGALIISLLFSFLGSGIARPPQRVCRNLARWLPDASCAQSNWHRACLSPL